MVGYRIVRFEDDDTFTRFLFNLSREIVLCQCSSGLFDSLLGCTLKRRHVVSLHGNDIARSLGAVNDLFKNGQCPALFRVEVMAQVVPVLQPSECMAQ